MQQTSILRHRENDQYFVVKTQHNSTQLKATLKQLALRLDTVVTWNLEPTTHPPTTNFSATFRPAAEKKFGTDSHKTNLIRKT